MFVNQLNKKVLLLSTLLIISGIAVNGQFVVINEFMSSNSYQIADEDGDYSDWIELLYVGKSPLNIGGYGISDDKSEPFRWIFPDITLLQGDYLLLWASGKNKADPAMPLHTNFSIKAEGEPLLLTHPDGTTISEVDPVNLCSDLSYGRKPDGTGNWYYFSEPTPGTSNQTQGYTGFLDPPQFSQPGGFYTDEFWLTISHTDPDALIYYTLDGSEPYPERVGTVSFSYKNQYPYNPGDPFGEFLTASYRTYPYTDSIFVRNVAGETDSITHISTTFHFEPYYFPLLPVFKGMVVRAAAFKEGMLKSTTITHSYFLTESGRERYTLPVFSICADKDDLFDYDDGIYTAGVDYDNWRTENPEALHNWETLANFHRNGDQWEKRSNIEFFIPGNTRAEFSQEIGFRINGNESRRRPMKSLRLYARSNYGEPSINYKFFENVDDDQFKTLILRNSGQDYYFTMLRDATIQEMVKDLKPDTQDNLPSILFINGEYWGIHNLRERYDKYYFERVYGIDPDNIDYLVNLNEIQEGDREHYDETIGYIEQNGLVEDEHYQYIQTRMDVDNFRDYQIINIFVDNHDWPGNNLEYWRMKTPYNPDAPAGQDGRWRWLVKDLDFGFGLFGLEEALQHNMLEFASAVGGPEYPNPEWSTFLFRKLLENEDFKFSFINRFADLLNTTFLPSVIENAIYQAEKEIEKEIDEHILRWKNLYHHDHWLSNLDVMYQFAEQRPVYQNQHILDFFQLNGQYTINLDVSNHWHGMVRLNSIVINENTPGARINPYPWSGQYYKGVPVELEAMPAQGYIFTHWSGDTTSTEKIIKLNPTTDYYVKANFKRVDVPRLVNFWLLNTDLPNDTPMEEVNPIYQLKDDAVLTFQSALEGYPFYPGHPNWRKASLERRNAPTPINYRPEGNQNIPYESSNMRGIQVKQPFTGDGGENTLIFHLPTTGIRDVVFRFAAKDEGAADNLVVSYSVDETPDQWTSEGIADPIPLLGTEYQLYTFDFEELPSTDDNPNFKIRILFGGENMSIDEGNRVTFNNFSLDGTLLTPPNVPPEFVEQIAMQHLIEDGEEIVFDLDDLVNEPDNDTLYYSVNSSQPLHAYATVVGRFLTVYPIQRGTSTISLTVTDSIAGPVMASFDVIIYPGAFSLHENKITFESWDETAPENAFPEYMLFMQSNMSDPGLTDSIFYPYFIPHDDYAPEDQQNIGFPYKNTQRTRINGLKDNGISFINTGTNRDLGGLLIALDTRDVSFAFINWTAALLEPNDMKYAVRLQYRTDINQPFEDLLVDNQAVEYNPDVHGDLMDFSEIPLPVECLDLDYLQLFWRYYHVAGVTGGRPQLRLDGISISDITYVPEFEEDDVLIYYFGNQINVSFTEKSDATCEIFDISGRRHKTISFTGEQNFEINTYPLTGIYIIRIITSKQVFVKKLFFN